MNKFESFSILPHEETAESTIEAKRRREKKTLSERFRKIPFIRESVLALGVLGGAIPALYEEREVLIEKKVKKEITEEKYKKIKELFGEYGLQFIENRIWAYKQQADLRQGQQEAIERNELSLETTDIVCDAQGYINQDHVEVKLTSEDLSQILEQTFPKGWCRGEINRVLQANEEAPMNNALGLSENWRTLAWFHRGLGEIKFFSPAKDKHINDIVCNTLPHEVAHANDWVSDDEMSSEERVDLLLAVGERVRAEDRYISDYVEAINNEDLWQENYLKAQEYWAEICAQYFDYAGDLNYKDFKIVDDFVKKTDPSFDSEEASKKRWSIVLDSTKKQLIGENHDN